MTTGSEFPIVTQELKDRINTFKRDWYQFYKKISKKNTPKVDGTGRKIVDRRPDGYDYIIEAWMRQELDKMFPGWSWEMGGPPQFLGSEWVFVWGTLSIIDENLAPFNINPPIRKFSATNGVRVKFKRDAPHTAENIIDVGNDVASANSKAFKKAVNQLTHIGDDVYGKRVEEEGSGSYEEVLKANPDKSNFGRWLSDHKILYSEAKNLVGEEINNKDYQAAVDKIKKAKNIK